MSLFNEKDLKFLKALRILPPEEPELATSTEVRECLRGQKYWDLMERTAARVDKWPAWKTGTKKEGK
jgi:hypothetical protein